MRTGSSKLKRLIMLNRGSNAGIKVGQVFDVYKLGKAVRDPDTGEVLGSGKKKVGQGSLAAKGRLRPRQSLRSSSQPSDAFAGG